VQPSVDACLRVEIATGENRNYQFKTHPNIDKQLYTRSNVLGLKDPARPFPTEGAPVGILKWRMQVAFASTSVFWTPSVVAYLFGLSSDPLCIYE
jgi:hypothetical protein